MKVVKITGDNTTTKPLNQNRMEAKEKAKELFDKYFIELNEHNECYDEEAAIQCALTAVDEIINQCWDYREIDLEASYNYWDEVRQEIINF